MDATPRGVETVAAPAAVAAASPLDRAAVAAASPLDKASVGAPAPPASAPAPPVVAVGDDAAAGLKGGGNKLFSCCLCDDLCGLCC